MKKILFIFAIVFIESLSNAIASDLFQNQKLTNSSSSKNTSVFLQRLKNTIQKQIENSYQQATSSILTLNPPYAYNTILGFDPNKKVISNKRSPIATNPESALAAFYLRENYDDHTISKIFQNLKAVNPYTMLIESPMSFLKAEPLEDLEQPKVSKVIVEEKIVTNPEEFPRFLEKTPLRSPTNEFVASKIMENQPHDNNIFVVKNPSNDAPSLTTIEKIPIFIPIPIFGSYNVPVYHHQDYQQKIKELIPEPIEIPVEHQTMEPVPIIVQKSEKVFIPQAVPYGVKIPYEQN